MKIIEYDLLGYRDYEDFVYGINEALEKNWQPYGGTFVAIENNVPWYYQAMVKYAPEPLTPLDTEVMSAGPGWRVSK